MVTLNAEGGFSSELQPTFFTPVKNDPIADTVIRLLSTHGLNERRIERRKERRYPFAQLLKLTPVCPKSHKPLGDPIHAVGRQISAGGIDFFYNGLLTNNYFLFHPKGETENSSTLLLKLKWCHYLGDGWYLTGGQFTDLVPLQPSHKLD